MAKMEMDIINTHCAGIDIGSRSHFVATGQELHDVKEFGVYAEDLTAICVHLKAHQINSVAMESIPPKAGAKSVCRAGKAWL